MDGQNVANNNSNPWPIVFWLISIVLVGFISYIVGKNSNIQVAKQEPVPTVVLNTLPTTVPTPTLDLQSTCTITGPAQKKDYLVPYTLKEGDTINKIAQEQLGDTARNTEITTLNDNIQQLTIGSTLYLPPTFIKSSSGHIAQVSGKIVKKDDASWQLSYGGGPTGPGIVIPGFWFKDLTNLDEFQLGDCVTILFDNSVKVYSVKKS